MNSGIYNDFLKENFIFLHISKDRVPFILDYTQSANEIIQEFLEFDKIQNFTTLYYSNNSEQSNEFKEKIEGALKLGSNLFINNIIDINKPYYLFFNYINQKYRTSNSKKYVKIDDHEYEKNDKSRLFLFKNIYGNKMMKLDNSMWFSLIFVNFNLSKEELKERIFLDISKTRNELAFNGYKKFRNEKVKQSLTKIDSEKKIIKTMLEFDPSGNVEKLTNIEALNEKYKTDCKVHSNCERISSKVENKIKKQKNGLIENYLKLCTDSAKIFKTLYKFCFFRTSFLFQRSTLIKILNEFYIEKLSIIEELKNLNQYKIIEEEGDSSNKRKTRRRTTRIIKKETEEEKSVKNEEEEEYEEEEEIMEPEIGENPEGNENQEITPDIALGNVNPVIKEIYRYDNTKDAKSLIIFFYNKISKIFVDKEIKESLLLFFTFINANIEGKMLIPFKQCFLNINLFNNNFDECFEKKEIIKSPLENIDNKQWSILKKINSISGNLFDDLFNSIENNKDKWDKYLEDNLTDLSNNYYLNNLVFPDENLEKFIHPLIKFLFFYLVKPDKREFIIQIFLKKNLYNYNSSPLYDDILFIEKNSKKKFFSHMIKTQIEDLDITKAFKNFNAQKDKALILIAPNGNMNIYDKILYEYCYLKMFSSSSNNKDNNANAEGGKLSTNEKQSSKVVSELTNTLNEAESKENNEQISSQNNNNTAINNQQQKSNETQVVTSSLTNSGGYFFLD